MSTKQVVELAIEISNARDSEIPLKLLKIKDLIASTSDTQKLSADLYKYNLLKALVISFKHEYGHIRNGWALSVDLIKTFCECINVFFLSDKQYQDEFLPLSAQNILVLARKFQEKHTKTKVYSDENLIFYKIIMKEYAKMHSSHPNIILGSLKSPRLLQLLVTDEIDTSIITINILKEIMQIQRHILFKLNETAINTILDEVIYKLSVSDLLDLGLSSIQLLLVMCNLDPFFNKYLYKRYRGLKMLLSKWYGKGMGKELNEFVQLLEKADQSKTEDEKYNSYATIIQKVWRGYKARKRLKQISSAIGRFQKSYRQKAELKKEYKEKEMERNELGFQLAIEHTRKLRKNKLNMAELLQILPANEIEKYLEKQKLNAATKIQALFRGYKERKVFSVQKQRILRNKAAICIQRGVRKWLERIRKRREEPAFYSRPETLTSEKREVLLERIRVHLESLPHHPRSDKELSELHEKGQNMFKDYLLSQKEIHKQQQKMQVLLAMANHDSDMILNCPKLNEATDDDINNFYSHKSVPVMVAAKEEHKKALKKYRSKWYETFMSDSDSDEKLVFDGIGKDGNERLSFTNIIPKNEKNKLKSSLIINNKKSIKLPWLENDKEFESKFQANDHRIQLHRAPINVPR